MDIVQYVGVCSLRIYSTLAGTVHCFIIQLLSVSLRISARNKWLIQEGVWVHEKQAIVIRKLVEVLIVENVVKICRISFFLNKWVGTVSNAPLKKFTWTALSFWVMSVPTDVPPCGGEVGLDHESVDFTNLFKVFIVHPLRLWWLIGLRGTVASAITGAGPKPVLWHLFVIWNDCVESAKMIKPHPKCFVQFDYWPLFLFYNDTT